MSNNSTCEHSIRLSNTACSLSFTMIRLYEELPRPYCHPPDIQWIVPASSKKVIFFNVNATAVASRIEMFAAVLETAEESYERMPTYDLQDLLYALEWWAILNYKERFLELFKEFKLELHEGDETKQHCRELERSLGKFQTRLYRLLKKKHLPRSKTPRPISALSVWELLFRCVNNGVSYPETVHH